jgi:hypothetical protein
MDRRLRQLDFDGVVVQVSGLIPRTESSGHTPLGGTFSGLARAVR